MNQIRVLIVEDEPIIAADIEKCLQDLDYFVCGKAMTFNRAKILLETTYPDIAIIDINLEGKREGIELAAIIREKNNIPFIFLTSYSDAATLKAAKITMPNGYVVKPFDEQDLYATLEIALYNFAQIQKKLHGELNIAVLNKKLGNFDALSQREFEILEGVTNGYTNVQIGEKLFISVNTVKTHLKNLFQKLNVNSRTAAINRSRELGN